MIFSDETTIHLNTLKGIGMELARKKEDRMNSQAFDQGEYLGLSLKSRL